MIETAYVYIYLPGRTEAVTAARFTHETDRLGVKRGQLVYGRQYRELREAVPLDPVELIEIARARQYETVRGDGVFGALRDGSPDHWGRRVIARSLGGEPSEVSFLLHSPDDRAGALGFGLNAQPPAPKRDFNRTWDLEKLQAAADAIIADEPPLEPDVELMLLVGTAMGGARPKVVVEDDEGLWLAKFNRVDDNWNMARVEHATLKLAHACGLHVAETRLEVVGGRDVLLSKRFDRHKADGGYARSRQVSALTLLQTDDAPESRARWSYVALAELLRKVCARGEQDAHELYRRMAFNALISNVDDHPRNHAVVAPQNAWKLSPAYDLTPSPLLAYGRNLAMACGSEGVAATERNLLTECGRFMLRNDEAQAVIDEMRGLIEARWRDIFLASGVSAADCERLKRAFSPASFRGSPED
ncbi:type II toxin-antitoxin system HipA family toxin [Caulobacter endophyticus]|uniref:Type II toxin-antitoxin system HipA family toxin n=1 Tax=Caulobacter endophyticus TaxID=2172652 RepID=A0A2T9KCQ6_9CAUL|nr:HipA domain-containing protein [Caulobacter endophyticus]PVM93631.1 type II toxin-antitoxin system HipA family toxin [Caulobacter endophyticus]